MEQAALYTQLVLSSLAESWSLDSERCHLDSVLTSVQTEGPIF